MKLERAMFLNPQIASLHENAVPVRSHPWGGIAAGDFIQRLLGTLDATRIRGG